MNKIIVAESRRAKRFPSLAIEVNDQHHLHLRCHYVTVCVKTCPGTRFVVSCVGRVITFFQIRLLLAADFYSQLLVKLTRNLLNIKRQLRYIFCLIKFKQSIFLSPNTSIMYCPGWPNVSYAVYRFEW